MSLVRVLWSAFASIQLTLILLVIFAIASAAATFLESSVGTQGARVLVYNAKWFEVLLGLLTLNLVATLGRWFPFRVRQTGFFLVHVSMIVILVGAGMTRFLGHEGTMHIREGASSDMILSREDHVQIHVGEASASFPVRLYRQGPVSAKRRLTVDERSYRVAVKEYWPHYEPSHDHDHEDPDVLSLTVGTTSRSSLRLGPGQERRVGPVLLAYGESTLLSSAGQPPLGSLQVRVGEATGSVPVPAELPVTLEVGDVTFTITEFQADFTVGDQGEKPVRMSNPLIRVTLRTPAGDEDQRMLFAYHPDFAAQHGRTTGPLAAVETLYRFEPRLVFAGPRDSLHACASFALVELGAHGPQDAGHAIPPGRMFPVVTGAVYRTPQNDFSWVLQPSGAQREEESDAPAAVRIEIRNADGETGSGIVVRGTGPAGITVGDETVGAAFGPVRIDLPYALHLDDFRLLTYPGSDRPAGYESHVRLRDPERGIDDRPVAIRMNSPLTHRSRKHFQNSYDSDTRGTILIVNYDPGKWPTYVGYTLITLGFLLSLLKGVIWPPPRVTSTQRPGRPS